jgi:hypothetical protein
MRFSRFASWGVILVWLVGLAAVAGCDTDDDDAAADESDDDNDDNDNDDNNDNDNNNDTSPADDDDDDDDDDDNDDDNDDDDNDDDDNDDNDDDTFPPDDCETLEDPALPGAYNIVPFEYGQEGDPDARTTDVRQFYPFPAGYVFWVRGIHMNAVPLHGVGYYPEGDGPFPLVLIVHGNHDPAELSYPGYDYLTAQLATHGMIAISVEEDFLNGGSGEMDARGIVLLRNLQVFRDFNNDPEHPLHGKINMRWIGLAGHSRGGEAVGVAWLFNTTLDNPDDPDFDFGFHIRSLFAIAPVDGQLGSIFPQYVTLTDVDYFIMHGSHDGDVCDFQGHAMYDRALPVDQPTTGEKGLLFVQGANHGQWNTVWAPGGDPMPVIYSTTPLISAEDQQDIGRLFLTAWFRWTLQGQRCYRLMSAGEREFDSFPPDIVLTRQYQNATRVFLDHYEEDNNANTGSYPGVTNTGDGLAIYQEQEMSWGGTYGRFPGETDGLIVAWDDVAGSYRVDLPALGPEFDAMDMLAFRVGQLYESSDQYNVFGVPQDFSVQLIVGGAPTAAVNASVYRTLPSQTHVTIYYAGETSMTVLETVRIPLADFNGGLPLLPSDVEAVVFNFDQMPSGLLGFDEIQFSTW